MAEREGVIKYHLDYKYTQDFNFSGFGELNAWREICLRLGWIGQDSQRYGGLGFGNISSLIADQETGQGQQPFVISGTQTGLITELKPEHYCLVKETNAAQNYLSAEGPVKPSSEALTHGSVYAAEKNARFIIHIHSPELWHKTAQLGLPATSAEVAYGTPEMAEAVQRLFATEEVRDKKIFSMLGHEDGIVAFGETAEATGQVLIHYLSRALSLD